MLRAYTLRPPYEGVFAGGVISTGRDGGSINVAEELEKGNGEIVTDDHLLIAGLDNYHGAEGPVFQAEDVDDDGNRQPVVAAEVTAPQINVAPASVAPAEPEPEHHAAGYAGLDVEELQEIIVERGLTYGAKDSEDQLISILEAHDNEEGAPSNV